MSNLFMDALTAGKTEANDVTKITNSAFQNMGMGAQKDGLIKLSREVGMPQGYENKINMMRDPDGLGVIAKEILDKQGGVEKYSRSKLGAGAYTDAVADNEKAILNEMGVDSITALSPEDQARFKKRVASESSRVGKEGLLNSKDITNYDDYQMASALVPGDSASSDGLSEYQRQTIEDRQSAFELRETNAFTAFEEKQRKEGLRYVATNFASAKQVMSDAGILGGVIEGLNEDLLIDGKKPTPEQIAILNQSGMGPRLAGVYSLGEGVSRNVLDQVTDLLGGEATLKPGVNQQAISATYLNFLSKYIKSMSGLAVTTEERKVYNSILGTGASQDLGQVHKNLSVFIDTIKRGAEQAKSELTRYGQKKYPAKGGSYAGYDASDAFAADIDILDDKIRQMNDSVSLFNEMGSFGGQNVYLSEKGEIKPGEKTIKEKKGNGKSDPKKASNFGAFLKSTDKSYQMFVDGVKQSFVKDGEKIIDSDGFDIDMDDFREMHKTGKSK